MTPSLEHRVLQRAAVDAAVGADLDVVADVHRAQLLDLFPAPFDRREAEAVGTDDRTAVQDAARADAAALADHDLRRQPGVLADHGMGADMALRPDHRAAADDRAFAHMRQRADAGLVVNQRTGFDHRARVHARRRWLARAQRPPLRQPGVVQVGVGADDRAGPRGHRVALAGPTITQPAADCCSSVR